MNRNTITIALVTISVASVYFGVTYSSLFGEEDPELMKHNTIPLPDYIVETNQTNESILEKISNTFSKNFGEKDIFEDEVEVVEEIQEEVEQIEEIVNETQIIEINESNEINEMNETKEIEDVENTDTNDIDTVQEESTNSTETTCLIDEEIEIINSTETQLINQTEEIDVKENEIVDEKKSKMIEISKQFHKIVEKMSQTTKLSEKSIVYILLPGSLAFIMAILTDIIFKLFGIVFGSKKNC